MLDEQENTVNQEVAPQDNNAQQPNNDPAEGSQPPADPADTGEPLLAGKYKTPQDLERAYKELETKLGDPNYRGTKQPPEPSAGTGTQRYEQSPFDETTEQGLNNWYNAKREQEKAAEFVQKNQDKLKDPLIDGTVIRLIRDANAKGERLEPEEALKQAEQLLETRLNPATKAAQAQGFQEGEELARKRQNADAIGDTGTKAQPKDDSQLSSKEFAEKYGLARV